MDNISGVVERITFMNKENGYSVIKIRSKGFPELITAVGNMASVNIGSVINLEGSWKVDSKYGKQFNVINYSEKVPATIKGIEKYLGSGLIKGIGPVYAKKIVKKFKEDTIRIIEETPDRLIETEGIGKKRIEIIKKAWHEQKEIKNVMLFLQSYDVSTAYAVKIYKTYGNDSIELVSENPYRLADEVWGIGFKTADQIADRMGYEKNSYPRCRAGIIYVLNQLSNDGHCYATKEQLIDESVKILDVEGLYINDAIDRMLEEKSIMLDYDMALYLPPFYYSEVGTANRINQIVTCKNKFDNVDAEKILEATQKESRISYDTIQIDAIKTAIKSKFMVLTGGPGTGKTTTTIAIIKAFEQMGASIILAAPTGRAAKRLSETTRMPAKTIHRLLEFKPAEGCKKNADNPLDCDVLIIDETSMVDIILMYNLLKAVRDEAIVILIGDVDQLPSVGAGNVLRDIIESGIVNVIKLKRVFRQARGSKIIMNAHRINEGHFPVFSKEKNNDCFFIKEDDPEIIVDKIVSLCHARLPNYYKVDPINDIQVICPMLRGCTGAHNLNSVLQQKLNPSNIYINYGGTRYNLNDKVMQIKNNYDKNVYNGDIGRIIKINLEEKTIDIKFDYRKIEYDITELDEIILAYATTVHKSQGSEYPVVVAPFSTQHFMMLQRNLLYTCVTRAKKILVLIGSTKALAIAISNNKITKRNTLLSERLKIR
jgi:exodeoxyribonuclease V alpha subunit